MILELYESKDEIYVRPEAVEAVIPVRNKNGDLLYTSVIINGKEYKTNSNPMLLIYSQIERGK